MSLRESDTGGSPVIRGSGIIPKHLDLSEPPKPRGISCDTGGSPVIRGLDIAPGYLDLSEPPKPRDISPPPSFVATLTKSANRLLWAALLFCSFFCLSAVEQPILLPLNEFTKQLDGRQEWMVLPLADWQALRDAAEATQKIIPPIKAPAGAWLESARVEVELVEDRELRCTAILTAVSLHAKPRRCPLFATLPPWLGAPLIDGAPALLVPNASGVDLLLPGAGRVNVVLTWRSRLEPAADGSVAGALVLPLAGACDLALRSATPGAFSAPALAANEASGARIWHLAQACGSVLNLAWFPGRDHAPVDTVLSAKQELFLNIAQGQRLLRWSADLTVHRGGPPRVLTLRPPAGWHLTRPVEGIAAISERDGTLLLELKSGASTVACEGWCDDSAMTSIAALPAIVEAVVQGGTVNISGDAPLDYRLPETWRVLSGDASSRRFAVPGPDAGMAVATVLDDTPPTVSSQALLAIGPQVGDWALSCTLSLGACRRFSLPLRLPEGWKLKRFQGPADITVGGNAPGDEASDVAQGELEIIARDGFHAPRQLVLELERVSETTASVAPAWIPIARRQDLFCVVRVAPAIATVIAAPPTWRLSGNETPDLNIRTRLSATGEPAPVRVTATVRPPACSAEAVVCLHPGRDRTWCRMDLKLTVREGELDACDLVSPFAAKPALMQLPAETGWNLEDTAGVLHLRSTRRWSGERLLRLEGPLATAHLGQLPVPALTLPGGRAVPLRLCMVLHAASDGDLLVERGQGWRNAEVDDVPAWSAAIPGEPVVAVLRRQPDTRADGSWSVVERPLARLPAAFVDRLQLRTRIAIDGQLTLARFLLAAPELQALPLGLPTDARLVEATIDGEAVAPRRRAGGLELPLPGRTQVQVALLYSSATAPNHRRLEPPRFGDLPVTRTAWELGVDASLRAELLQSAGIMSLEATGEQWWRPWFANWTGPSAALDDEEPIAAVPISATQTQAADPRALTPNRPGEAGRGEPTLPLSSQRYAGRQLGGGLPVVLTVTRGERLVFSDHFGLALALIAAALLAWWGRWRTLVATTSVAIATATALHGWQLSAGPVLALAEWLPLFLTVAIALRWLWNRVPFHALAALLLAPGFISSPLDAGEATATVLMGYERLDERGQPLNIRVALPRDRFTALWKQAHPDTVEETPVVALATGAPEFTFTCAPGSVEGSLRLAFAVPGTHWQSVTLPLPGGTVRDCKAETLGGAPLPRLAWRSSEGGLILDLPPRSQGIANISLALPMAARNGTWRVALPRLTLPGGCLRLRVASGWMATLNGSFGIASADAWRWDLPTDKDSLHVQLMRGNPPSHTSPDTTASTPRSRTGKEVATQRLALGLVDGGLSWRCELGLSGFDATPTLRLDLPSGLVLTSVEGPGLADWRQEGAAAHLSWRFISGTRALILSGLITGAGTDAAVMLQVPDARHGTGRIDLTHGSGARFLVPEAQELSRVDPLKGAHLALRWDDDPGVFRVTWARETADLRGQARAALRVGADRAQLAMSVRLSGRGGTDVIAWNLPEPWQMESFEGARQPAHSVVLGTGAERRVELRTLGGAWNSGHTAMVVCSASRRDLGQRFTPPDAVPRARNLHPEHTFWQVGGAADGRLRLAEAGRLKARPLNESGSDLPADFAFTAGERWLFSGLATATPPTLLEETVAARAQVAGRHYLVLTQDRLRWWARLDYSVEAGTLNELRCTLPEGVTLVALRSRDLGSWTQEGREVVARLSAPARGLHRLELDLEKSLIDGQARISAPTTPWPAERSRVALVDEDGTGLVHLDPQGLTHLDAADSADLPVGVDASQVPNRWRSERSTWQLGVRRETVGETGGADGVVTLVDGLTALAADGESRSHAVWHLLNRTRTRLEVSIPAGVALWEARVDGHPVVPREDRSASTTKTPEKAAHSVFLPITPLRPGAAATRIELTWNNRSSSGSGSQRLDPPCLTGLKVVQAVWRCSAPAGWRLLRRGGGLEEVLADDAEALRAQRVLDDVARLNRLTGLSDHGLRRQAEQLAVLDQELNDHLSALERMGLSGKLSAPNTVVTRNVVQQRKEVGEQQKKNSVEFFNRNQRRQQLQFFNNALNWTQLHTQGLNQQAEAQLEPADAAQPQGQQRNINQTHLNALPLTLQLGPGQAPPGWRAAAGGSLLGIELVSEQPGMVLELRGQGVDLSVEISLSRLPGIRWPWLALLTGTLVALVALAIRKRS